MYYAKQSKTRTTRFSVLSNRYNSAKDVPNFCKWGLGLITGGEHISRLVEMPQRKVCLWQTLIEGIIIKGLSHESIFVRIAPFSLTSITVI